MTTVQCFTCGHFCIYQEYVLTVIINNRNKVIMKSDVLWALFQKLDILCAIKVLWSGSFCKMYIMNKMWSSFLYTQFYTYDMCLFATVMNDTESTQRAFVIDHCKIKLECTPKAGTCVLINHDKIICSLIKSFCIVESGKVWVSCNWCTK